MPPEIVTIGAYGWDAGRFFAALAEARVEAFCDLRARRGVRGREYAWANSRKLQAALMEHGIRYLHFPELAPTGAARAAQAAADKAAGVAKRKRSALGAAFVEAYQQERLSAFDPSTFLSALGSDARVVALFCVERDPAACHRSLLAARLAGDLGTPVLHLLP
jgi:uncharacterized protein (DUF488 family)